MFKTIGIIIVVNTSLGGDQLLFRYPSVLRKSVSAETMNAFAVQLGKRLQKDDSPKLRMSTFKQSEEAPDPLMVRQQRELEEHDAFNLPSVSIAPQLCPKPALCNQCFEFTIENSTFVGYPTLCQRSASKQQQQISPRSPANSPRLGLTNSNNQLKTQTQIQAQTQTQTQSQTQTQTQANTQQQNAPTDSTQDGSPSNAQQQQQQQQQQQEQQQSKDELRVFNVCFALARVDEFSTCLDIDGTSTHANSDRTLIRDRNNVVLGTLKQFKELAKKISLALAHEQQRCNYVWEQSQILLNIRDSWLVAQKEERSSFIKPDHQALTSQLLSSALLARELHDIYYTIREQGVVNIRFNGWIGVIASIKDPNFHQSWPIRPYQTLLLLPMSAATATTQANNHMASSHQQHQQQSHQQGGRGGAGNRLPMHVPWSSILPTDTSPTMRKFVEMAKPTKSFRELQLETGIPLNELYKMSAHLVYWGKARIINTLTKTNVYILNWQTPVAAIPLSTLFPSTSSTTSTSSSSSPASSTPTSPATPATPSPPPTPSLLYYRALAEEFSKLFPSFRFEEMLERFSQMKALGEHVDLLITSLQRDFVEVVIWLLQKNLIVQLHTYIYLTIPNLSHSNSRGESEKRLAADRAALSSSHNINPPSAPSPLKPHESAFLDKVADKGPTFQLLQRLCPYFRGRHHIEEIMWRENISRDDLNTVLTKYTSILVTCIHEADYEEREFK